jgi:hypothetical protein
LVWSATFVIVVTTVVMFRVFSLITASFDEIDAVALRERAHRRFHPFEGPSAPNPPAAPSG